MQRLLARSEDPSHQFRLSQFWDTHSSERPQSLRLEAVECDVSAYWIETFPNQTHMLLTIRTTHQPATDLGFLLHKHS